MTIPLTAGTRAGKQDLKSDFPTAHCKVSASRFDATAGATAGGASGGSVQLDLVILAASCKLFYLAGGRCVRQ